MRAASTRWSKLRLPLVLSLLTVVHAVGTGADGNAQVKRREPSKSRDKADKATSAMPRSVQEMVDAIKSAVQSGRIEDLNDAVDWNEMRPDLGPAFVADPVAYWKSISADGTGKDILAVLGALLERPPAVQPLGRDIENNRLYVWPAFADTPPSKLTSAESEALARLVSPDKLAAMRATDRYSGWRLVLGADGTWHSFRAD